MSRSQTRTPSVNDSEQVFEYVVGVMRGSERQRFAQRLVNEPELQAQVRYWEEHLMALSNKDDTLQPADDTWEKIHARINRSDKPVAALGWRWLWQSVSALSVALLMLLLWLPNERPLVPNPDYVAVLTDERDVHNLTVLTAAEGKQLWLKWGAVQIPEDKNVQLWAISKRDGQIRPLNVFSATDTTELTLSIAQLRLIKDASHLLLTEEDVGGSPLDEPSDIVLAKGICVLLAPTAKTI